ncbi:MAG TPA: formate dehydrogenase accessory protein FdhE [Vicinamibacterales bacterium]|nr:formate dehydrogenase accessory protein FdhE [Vicinamibacterales bacterium]
MSVEPQPRRTASETPAVAALRELKAAQPELAPAADLQIELAQIMRRLSARAPLPALAPTDVRQARLTEGVRILSFPDFRFDWSDVRLALREVARALEAVGALPAEDEAAVSALVRGETAALERCLARWFNGENGADVSEGFLEVCDTAMRPFMARAALAALTGLDLAAWNRTICPACGAEADFAVIAKDGRRHLSCHRCRTQWPWHAWACPRCENADQQTISSFASRDGHYRIYACGKCGRYLKAFDCRTAPRPFLAEVDLIATLPLDAAAIAKGFTAL